MSIVKLFDDPRHRTAEEKMDLAERAERTGDLALARGIYAEATHLEEAHALDVPGDDPRMRALFGVSAIAQWLRAERWDDALQADALELVAWMIARGILDVKVAVPCGPDRKPIAAASTRLPRRTWTNPSARRRCIASTRSTMSCVRRNCCPREYEYAMPGIREPLRVTTSRELFEDHPATYELWSPGSPLFPMGELNK